MLATISVLPFGKFRENRRREMMIFTSPASCNPLDPVRGGYLEQLMVATLLDDAEWLLWLPMGNPAVMQVRCCHTHIVLQTYTGFCKMI